METQVQSRATFVIISYHSQTDKQTVNVKFDSGKSVVKSQYYAEVEKLANLLKSDQNKTITIEGHTDNTGSSESNQKLSEARAQAIKDILVAKYGITSERINTIGYGEGQPIASNDTEAGRAQNRRIMVAVFREISNDLAPYLLSFTYTDNAHGKTDDISLTLHDRDGIWKQNWIPEKGDTISAAIAPYGFRRSGEDDQVLKCGNFQVDEVTIAGWPQTIEIKGVSIPLDGNLRREKRSKTWSKTTLKQIAKDVVKGSSLELSFLSDNNPYYPSRYQHDESDLAFLQKLCEQAGLSLKITDQKLVIFDELEFELKPAALTISIDDINLKSFHMTTQAHEVYKACTVRYHDSGKKKSNVYTFTPPNAPSVGQVLNVDERVETLADAQRLAKKRLREKNKYETTGTLEVVGDSAMYAGINIGLTGWGRYDGKFHIDKVTHKVTSGYNTSIEFHRCIEF